MQAGLYADFREVICSFRGIIISLFASNRGWIMLESIKNEW